MYARNKIRILLFLLIGSYASWGTATAEEVLVYDKSGSDFTITVGSSECGEISSATYAYGTGLTIYADPVRRHRFLQWSDGNKSNPRRFTVLQDATFIAQYEEFVSYNTVTVVQKEGGIVSGGGEYEFGDTCVLSVQTDPGYFLIGWSDGEVGNPRLIEVSADMVIEPIYATSAHHVVVNSTGCEQVNAYFVDGVVLTMSSVPDTGYHFLRWSDGDTDNPRTITVTSDTTLTAEFAINQYSVVLSANDASFGSVSGEGTYDYNTQVTLTATPATDYHFVRWSDGNTDNPRTITVTSDVTLTAVFESETIATGRAEVLSSSGRTSCEYVQLWEGGPKWATFNVGATITDYADLTIGADATPFYDFADQAPYYNTANVGGLYAWNNPYLNGRKTTLAKDVTTGIVDVATSLWGKNWQTPTQAQLDTLQNSIYGKTTWTWCDGSTTQYVPGCTLTGYKVSGVGKYATNCIFLPASGYYFFYESGLVNKAKLYGFYWSSSENGTNISYDLYFDSLSLVMAHRFREDGLSVRAVLVDTVTPLPNTLQMVDLGLPSQILWANMNVGAHAVNASGSVFAWGEIATKSEFGSQNYTCDAGIKVLGEEYDAASQHWGSAYRMPSSAEWQELLSTCSWQEYTIGDSIDYYKVTGPNGNYIYIPIPLKSQNEAGELSKWASYWSSEACDNLTANALWLEHAPYRWYYLKSCIERWLPGYIRPVSRAYKLTLTSSFPMAVLTGAGSYRYGEEVTISARSQETGTEFVQWSDGNTDNPRTITITGDLTLEAEFSLPKYTVTVETNNPEWGTVTGGGTYDSRTPVVLCATANKGYYLSHWSNGYTFDIFEAYVNSDTTFTAYFKSLDDCYVDLGLPSGTLWAEFNIGANSAYQTGDFFAWGETEPKSVYEWLTYQYGRADHALTKYCVSKDFGKDGFTDGKTQLEASDDAATVVMGEGWRIPTHEEWWELKKYCKWTAATEGILATSSINGNYILFPYGGYRWQNSRQLYTECFYWTSDLYESMCYDADAVKLVSGNVIDFRCMRAYGLPIRAIHEPIKDTEHSISEGIEAVEERCPVVKRIVDGQLMIFREGKVYNVQGMEIRVTGSGVGK